MDFLFVNIKMTLRSTYSCLLKFQFNQFVKKYKTIYKNRNILATKQCLNVNFSFSLFI